MTRRVLNGIFDQDKIIQTRSLKFLISFFKFKFNKTLTGLTLMRFQIQKNNV